MPTYSLVCSSCGTYYSIKKPFSERLPSVCPLCGGVMRQEFAPPLIVYKCGGFYSTDK